MCNLENFGFSVSMCVYKNDNPKHFKIAVESILNQTVKPNQVVLVVDGPVTEELDTIIKEYEQNLVFKVIRLKKNMGHGNARRIGFENCDYDLIALMDADDISAPDRFMLQLDCFKKNENLDICGGNITEFIGDAENIVGKRIVPESNKEIKEYMKTRCPMNQVTVMFKKSAVDNAGGYIDWYCEEDYYLWVRMYLNGVVFQNVSETLVNVRVGKEMYNRRGGVKYFKSEAKLQKFMLDKKIIGFGTYSLNVLKRFIVQVLLPNKIRGFVFKKFAREKQ